MFKKLIDLIKKLLGLGSKPKPTVTPPTVTPTVAEEMFYYTAEQCETAHMETVSSFKELVVGNIFFMSNRENTGCYKITGGATEGKRSLARNIRIFDDCTTCSDGLGKEPGNPGDML